MNRDEAKTLMRQELERDIDAATRTKKMFPIGERLLSANDLMEEVESETDLGKYLLDDFIAFKDGGGVDEELTGTERAHAIALMENDLKIAPPGWADEIIFEEAGKAWTPNEIMKEVRAGTDFGNRYMVVYLANHEMLEALLGKGYDQADQGLFSLPPTTKKATNDKAN